MKLLFFFSLNFHAESSLVVRNARTRAQWARARTLATLPVPALGSPSSLQQPKLAQPLRLSRGSGSLTSYLAHLCSDCYQAG